MIKFFSIIVLLLFSLITFARKAPYQFQLDGGFQFSEAYIPTVSIQLFNGVKIPHWSAEAGIAAGFDKYEPLNLFTISIGVKWLPEINQRWIPYLGLNAGVAIASKENLGQFQSAGGGSLVNPSAGIRFNNSHLIKLNFNVAFKVQKAKITTYDGISDDPRFIDTDQYTFRRLFLGLGLSF